MSALVEIPSYLQAIERIKACHETFRSDTGPMNMRLLGQSGMGKTFFLQAYRKLHPPRDGELGRQVPVALVTIPSAPTVKSFYQAILESLGVHGARGTTDALRYRAKFLSEKCGVELFLIDELNHLTDRGSLPTRLTVSDALKELLDTLNRPAVFAGAPRSHVIFDTNMQLRSRVMATLSLRPFNIDARLAELTGFLHGLAGHHINEQAAIQLTRSDEIVARIFFATDGVPRQIVRFVERVANEVKRDKRIIDAALLGRIFQEHFWEQAPADLNPFCQNFPMRRLCEPKEPYAPSILDGDNHLLWSSPSSGTRGMHA